MKQWSRTLSRRSNEGSGGEGARRRPVSAEVSETGPAGSVSEVRGFGEEVGGVAVGACRVMGVDVDAPRTH